MSEKSPTIPPTTWNPVLPSPGDTGDATVDPHGDTDFVLAPHGIAVEELTPLEAGAFTSSEADLVGSDDPLLGVVLDGRYRVISRIGQGGMGVVYEVEHVSLGRRMAIKVLASGLQMNDLDAKRFRREAEVTARIAHPHIVAVTDCGKTPDGRHYFVMEYLTGADLATLIQNCKHWLDPDWVVKIGIQVCLALQAVHEVGVVHRDIKPENIFLTGGPNGDPDFVKVLDFGIARVEDPAMRLTRLTRLNTTVGTFAYMSPEQARGVTDLDGRTDIYSLGAVLYELLTGMLPIPGEGFAEILSRKQTDDPVSIRMFRPDVSEALEQVILCALCRDRNLRYATMTEFRAALERVMQTASEVQPTRPSVLPAVDVPSLGAIRVPAMTTDKTNSASRGYGMVFAAVGVVAFVLVVLVSTLVTLGGSGAPARLSANPTPVVQTRSISGFRTQVPLPVRAVKAVSAPPHVPAPAVSAPAASKSNLLKPVKKRVASKVKSASNPDAGPSSPALAPAQPVAARAVANVSNDRAEMERQVAAYKLAIRRNPRNREARAKLRALCRTLASTDPACQ